MQLTIKRNQADIKGLFGGHKGVSFSLSGQCSVSSDEKALIERYKVGSYELASYQMKIKGGTALDISITVDGIIAGKVVETNDIKTLLELEDAMRKGCENLKSLLEVMATFGGQQVYNI